MGRRSHSCAASFWCAPGAEEGYAEVTRLLHVPFGSPYSLHYGVDPLEPLLKDDPHYDELLHHPPRL